MGPYGFLGTEEIAFESDLCLYTVRCNSQSGKTYAIHK